MAQAKYGEEVLYDLVKMGLLHVMADGTIWKTGELRGNRCNDRMTIRPVKRCRAENATAHYLQVRKMINGKRIHCMAHRLVWRHFVGPIPPGVQMNHRNGIKTDNRPENLELVTHSENMKHAFRTGLKDQHGERHPGAKLTNGQVEAIRCLHAAGTYTQAKIAAMFGVSPESVSGIVRRKCWHHLP